jgi:hypothetical protein
MLETPDPRWRLNDSEGHYSGNAVKEIALLHGWPDAKNSLFGKSMPSGGMMQKLCGMTLQEGIAWLGPIADEQLEIMASLDLKSAIRFLTKQRGHKIVRA